MWHDSRKALGGTSLGERPSPCVGRSKMGFPLRGWSSPLDGEAMGHEAGRVVDGAFRARAWAGPCRGLWSLHLGLGFT